MKKKLIYIFEAFRNTPYYNQTSPEFSMKWLEGKLDSSELEELEQQIYVILLKNEESLFINTLKFIWHTINELSTLDS